MAGATTGVSNSGVFSRTELESSNRNKVPFVFDFPFGLYRAQRTFFAELSRIQNALSDKSKFLLPNGKALDLETTGGLLGLNLYMESLNANKDAMSGLAQLGINNEKKLWQLR